MAAISYLIWLTTRDSIRADMAVNLLRHFGTAEAVYYADRAEYDLLRIPPRLRDSMLDKRLDSAEGILERCDRQGITLLTCQDAAYPERLYQLDDHPLVLYAKGKLPRVDKEVAIGMVGSRKCTPYGQTMAGRISMDLARSGAVVVSGMAEGIDAASLKGALQGGGRVISVLAGGVDVVYPACNRWLYEDIQISGALISENPPGTRPEGWRFPIRNRIISGLSLGVLVVEAAERSGALITAHDALDQGRDVFAVPGPADAPMSGGTNLLISRGEARLVRSAWDILGEYTGQYPQKLTFPPPLTMEESDARLAPEPAPAGNAETEDPTPAAKEQEESDLPLKSGAEFDRLGEEQREIFLLLTQHRLTAEDIVGRTEIPARRVNTALTILQAQGYLKELPGRRFAAAVRFDQDR